MVKSEAGGAYFTSHRNVKFRNKKLCVFIFHIKKCTFVRFIQHGTTPYTAYSGIQRKQTLNTHAHYITYPTHRNLSVHHNMSLTSSYGRLGKADTDFPARRYSFFEIYGDRLVAPPLQKGPSKSNERFYSCLPLEFNPTTTGLFGR